MERRPQLTYKFDLPGGEARLREMVLYVSERCAEAKHFGKVKLNKILWRADFTAFAERGLPVTGRSYIKLAAGPAPAEMPPLLAKMYADGLLEWQTREAEGGYVEERPKALVKPNLRFFSLDDISFVDASVNYYWGKTATAASELSHQVAWRTRRPLDPFPYESVFFSDRKLTPQEESRFAEHARTRRLKSL